MNTGVLVLHSPVLNNLDVAPLNTIKPSVSSSWGVFSLIFVISVLIFSSPYIS